MELDQKLALAVKANEWIKRVDIAGLAKGAQLDDATITCVIEVARRAFVAGAQEAAVTTSQAENVSATA